MGVSLDAAPLTSWPYVKVDRQFFDARMVAILEDVRYSTSLTTSRLCRAVNDPYRVIERISFALLANIGLRGFGSSTHVGRNGQSQSTEARC
jgi:hypothetical protein